MTDLPDYAHATRDVSHYEMLKQFARRMPKPCPHRKKALSNIWEGEAMDYHLMKCVECGMSEIWPVSKSGKVLMNSDFTKPHKFFYQIIQLYKEAKQ